MLTYVNKENTQIIKIIWMTEICLNISHMYRKNNKKTCCFVNTVDFFFGSI